MAGRRRLERTGSIELARRRSARGAASTMRGQRTLWIAAERLPQFRALWPEARLEPPIAAPRRHTTSEWSARRGAGRDPARPARRPGPGDAGALAAPLGLTPDDIAAALAALESRRLRDARPLHAGRARPRNGASAACSRASTATRSSGCAPRSSRSRRATSCASCSPGSASRPTPHGEGPTRSPPSSASSKASRRRPAPGRARSCRRGRRLRPAWLDDHCLAGHIAWTRLRPRSAATGGGDGRQRRCARRRSRCWRAAMRRSGRRLSPQPTPAQAEPARAGGRRLHRATTAPRSSTSCWTASRLLRPQVEEALAELVALGLVTSDSFAGLRALLVPSSERKPAGARRRRARRCSAMEDAGRWALVAPRRPPPTATPMPTPSSTSRARCCAATASCSGGCSSARPRGCRRGAICCASIAGSKPRRDPRRPLRRRLLGRAVRAARGDRHAARGPPPAAVDEWSSVSGADPLNLAGILTPGPRLAALTGNRLLYRDGVPTAPWPAARSASSKPSMPRPNGRPARRCCAARCRHRWSRSGPRPPDVAPAGS